MREFSVLYFIFLLGQFAVTVHTSLLKVQFLDNIGNEVGKIKQASSSLLFFLGPHAVRSKRFSDFFHSVHCVDKIWKHL